MLNPQSETRSTGSSASPFEIERLSAVLDAQALAQLVSLDPQGSKGLLMRVLNAYLSSGPRLLQQLRDAVAAGDLAATQTAAHTLKSSSASVGALTLSRHCAELEACARDGQHSALGVLADALIAEGEHVFAALQTSPRGP